MGRIIDRPAPKSPPPPATASAPLQGIVEAMTSIADTAARPPQVAAHPAPQAALRLAPSPSPSTPPSAESPPHAPAAAALLGVSGFHHVALIASDYAKSRDFYVCVLGLTVIHEHFRAERDSWKLDLAWPDGSQLELFTFPQPPARASRPEACGLRHLALKVTDLDAAVRHLEAHGVAPEPIRIDEFTGARFCFFADPDGLPLELVEALRA
jgi:glyoxylase I family protein